MGKVHKIGILRNLNDQKERGPWLSKIDNVIEIEVIQGKGIVGDNHFAENNEKIQQISLIEMENIDFYNKISKTSERFRF